MTFLSSSILGATLRAAVPVDPDAPEAELWLRDELGKPEYLQAQPTLFDRIVQGILDWLFGGPLGQGPSTGGSALWGNVAIVVIIVVIIVVAFLIFGLPRLNKRSRVTGALFGDDDSRASTAIRRSAESAAKSGDFSFAIAEMYRALARGLAERTVVSTSPGTTAHDFAGRAAIAFPADADDLRTSAIAFDDVRYLDVAGTADRYNQVAALESRLRSAKPAALEAVGS